MSATGSTGSGRLSFTERRFVTKAADAGKEEVQLAQLAAQQATNPEVKRFAQKLVDDHSKVNSELMSLAGQKNVKLDQDEGRGLTYRRMANRSGAEFDQEFIEHMIDQHENDVKMFEKAATDARDPELRAFASKHVGHLREHLQQAQSLRTSITPTGRTDSYSGRSDSGASGSASTGSGSTSTTGATSSGTGSSTGSSIGTKASGSDRSGDYSSPNPSASGSTGSSSGSSSSPKTGASGSR